MYRAFSFSLICLFLSLSSSAQTAEQKINYLKSHSATWDGEFKNMEKVFTPEKLQNQLILIGEGHGVGASYQIQFDLIKYLKAKTGFRYLLVELGYLDGLLLNEYITTGNEQPLETFFASHKGTYYWTKNVRDLYKGLYNLNKSLPANKKIVLLPVDLEFAHRAAITYLQQKIFINDLSNNTVGKKLSEIDAVKGVGQDILKSYQDLYSDFKTNESAYKNILADKFEDIQFLMRNLHERFNIAVNRNDDTRRDSVMLENFNIYKKRYALQKEKIVGLFGAFHVMQTDIPSDISFASLLKKSNAVKGIVSARLVYEGGKLLMPKYNAAAQIDTARSLYKMVPNTYDYFTGSFEDGDLLGPLAQNHRGILFDLVAKGSPFLKSKSFLMQKDQIANIEDMCQILIVLNNSPAAEPLEGEAEVVQ